MEAEESVKKHSELVFMLGFMRSFDPSYQYAKKKVDAGEIGRMIMVRSYGQDPGKFIDGLLSMQGIVAEGFWVWRFMI